MLKKGSHFSTVAGLIETENEVSGTPRAQDQKTCCSLCAHLACAYGERSRPVT